MDVAQWLSSTPESVQVLSHETQSTYVSHQEENHTYHIFHPVLIRTYEASHPEHTGLYEREWQEGSTAPS